MVGSPPPPSWGPPPSGSAGSRPVWAPPASGPAPGPYEGGGGPPFAAGTPTYWAPPYPPPSPPKSKRARNVLIGISVVVGLLVVFGVIGAVAGKKANKTPTAPAVPTANLPGTPSGYTSFGSSADRFHIAVPSAWKQVDPTSPGAQAAINQMVQVNPSLKSLFPGGAQQLAADGIALVAIDPSPTASGSASNVNVLARPDLTYSDSELNQLASELPAELSRAGVRSTGIRIVVFAGHRALRATDMLPLKTPSGAQVTIDQTQYYVSGNGFLYVITLSGDDPAMTTIASSFSTS